MLTQPLVLVLNIASIAVNPEKSITESGLFNQEGQGKDCNHDSPSVLLL